MYRDDLAAAQARADALDRRVAQLEEENEALRASRAVAVPAPTPAAPEPVAMMTVSPLVLPKPVERVPAGTLDPLLACIGVLGSAVFLSSMAAMAITLGWAAAVVLTAANAVPIAMWRLTAAAGGGSTAGSRGPRRSTFALVGVSMRGAHAADLAITAALRASASATFDPAAVREALERAVRATCADVLLNDARFDRAALAARIAARAAPALRESGLAIESLEVGAIV